MPTIIKKSPDLLGGKYFCVGETNRRLISCRDSRKIVNLDLSSFGGILSSTSVVANPGAISYAAGVVSCLTEDGYFRTFALVSDILSGPVVAVNLYGSRFNWMWNVSTKLLAPWGHDGVQLLTAGGVVQYQLASGLSQVQNAYLVGSKLYCFDGRGLGVTLTCNGTTITRGELFDVRSGVNVDCIGLVNSTTLGIGANGGPRYITLNITDPDAPVWLAGVASSAPIGAISVAGPLTSTSAAPLSSDAGAYSVNAGGEPLTTNYLVAVNGGVIADFTTVLPTSLLYFYNFNNTLLNTAGAETFTVSSGTVAYLAPAVGVTGYSLGAPPSSTGTINKSFAADGGRKLGLAGWFRRSATGASVAIVTLSNGSNTIQMGGVSDQMLFAVSGTSTTSTTVATNVWVHLALSIDFAAAKFSYWVDGVLIQSLTPFTVLAEGGIVCNLTTISYTNNWQADNFYIGQVALTTGNVLALMNYVD